MALDSFGALALAMWTGDHQVVGADRMPRSCVAFIDQLFGDASAFDAPLSEALVNLALNDTPMGLSCRDDYRAIQAGPNPIVIVRDVEEPA